MSASDDDEDLKLAIALSLQSADHAASSSEILAGIQPDIPSNNETDVPSVIKSTQHPLVDSNNQTSDAPLKSSLGLLGLDRKAMEQERLARLAARKRNRSISPPPLRREETHIVKKQKVAAEKVTANNLATSASTNLPRTSGLQYPKGVVKKTWAFSHPRGDDIKIEEVLQKGDLRTAVLSAFQWDVEWVLSKLDTRKTKMIFVMQAKEEATRQQWREESKGIPNLRLCFPDMSGQVNCMHSKLMLLFYPSYIRIVVPSANLLDFDWGETGIMENSVFLIDLPRLPEGKTASKDDLTFFGKELLHFVEAMGLQQNARDGLLNFDFSETEHLAFVHTIGGTHYGTNLERTGHPGLSRALRQLNLRASYGLEIDFCASSIGSLNEKFIKYLYRSSLSETPSRNIAAKEEFPISLRDHFRIYYPTDETVRNSTGGPKCGGTICLQARWYRAPTFPKKLFRDYKSTRTGLLSHNKMLFARGRRRESPQDEAPNLAWAYIGSANISESAWGQLVMDRTKKVMKLNCRNWECGVLISVPPEEATKYRQDDGKAPPDMSAFDGIVPVPFQFPSQEIGDQKPWFYTGE